MALAVAAPWPEGHRRLGGWFWTLADDDEADDDDLKQPKVSSPTPSDLICESLQVGYSEEHVANCIDEVVPPNDSAWDGLGDDGDEKVEVLCRIVHRRSLAYAVRPWKGPLPKVRLPTLTLANFLDTSGHGAAVAGALKLAMELVLPVHVKDGE
ncbi:Myosin-4 [Hordeum vulgare]|nr:Myosin-4 [Hordeum vulgare]